MQLLIIDVQKTFKESESVAKPIAKLISNYSNVIHLYDIVSGPGEHPHDMWDEFSDDEQIYDRFKVLTKEYAFFRGLMDSTIGDEEFIVELGKLLIKNGMTDAREIIDLPFDEQEPFEKLFTKYSLEIDFEDHSFYIPYDLKESLEKNVQNGVHIVGGGYEECLSEVCLLLDMMDIEYVVLDEYTY